MTPISISYPLLPARRSLATAQVGDLFGLDESHAQQRHVVCEHWSAEIPLAAIVLFQGASGSGKSSMLRAVAGQLGALDVTALELPDEPAIDAVPGDFAARLDLLGACGLGEARLMLRRPAEMSDGQRYRFRLALALAYARRDGNGFIVADEFAAYLDRTLAKVVAYNLRKLCPRLGVGALLATTHTDIAEDLSPDVTVTCLGDGVVETSGPGIKKKACRSSTSSASPTAPSPTGRISRGGITARTASAAPTRS